ncbi:MAG: zinc metallopeptidase [Vampirovibrionales bacterium]
MFLPMPMAMDPFTLFVSLIGLPLIFLPQWWVKKTYNTWKEVPTARGMKGAEIAVDMLRQAGIHDVRVEETPDELGDHYSPSEKTVRLSPYIYHGRSVAAAAIAAHEIGHAMQHAQQYSPVVWRGNLFPLVNIGSQLGPMLFFISLMLKSFMGLPTGLTILFAGTGVVLFSFAVLFHFVTLPVELDASKRALTVLHNSGYLQPQEIPGAKKVLTSAAFTYISTALYAALELVSYVLRLVGLMNSNQQQEE